MQEHRKELEMDSEDKLEVQLQTFGEMKDLLGRLRENAIYEKGRMAGYVDALDKVKEVMIAQENNAHLKATQEAEALEKERNEENQEDISEVEEGEFVEDSE